VHATADTIEIIRALDRQWARLRESGRLQSALDQWAAREPALSGFSGIEELELAGTRTDIDRDAVLLALIRRAQQGPDAETASRLLVQMFAGMVVNLSWRIVARFSNVQDAAAAALGALCERIATYPVTARPELVAANLRLDTLKLALREAVDETQIPWDWEGTAQRGRCPHGVSRCQECFGPEGADLDEHAARHEAIERAARLELVGREDLAAIRTSREIPDESRARMLAVLVEAVRLDVLGAETARLVAESFAPAPRDDHALAGTFGCSVPALRKRRSRALAALRENRDRLAAAA
jgi:hypothetical protein